MKRLELGNSSALMGLLLVLASVPVRAFGQSSLETGPGAGPLELAPITVLGQKAPVDRQQAGTSVAIIRPGADGTGADERFDRLLQRTPNVAPQAGDRGIVIRGIGQTGFGFGDTPFPITRGPGDLVTTFVDGVPVSAIAGATSLFDVEQVEIYRGSQSTAFGRGALAGAVAIETRDATAEASLDLVGAVGTQDSLEGGVAFGHELVEDVLSVRVAAQARRDDGFNDNRTTGRPEDADELRTARLKSGADTDRSTRCGALCLCARSRDGIRLRRWRAVSGPSRGRLRDAGHREQRHPRRFAAFRL